MMVNLQLAEKPITKRFDTPLAIMETDGRFLDIVSVFRTIQGEGPFAGVPAIFIRLAGCNLKCPLCDTDYTTNRKIIATADIIDYVRAKANGVINLIVITGGEPFRQPLGVLIRALLGLKFHVQIETNGTLFDETSENILHKVSVVCSPKAHINKRLLPFITELKYVMKHDDVNENDGLPNHALNSAYKLERLDELHLLLGTKIPVYLQPADQQDIAVNKQNLDACIKSCMKYNYILSQQNHKLWGLD